MFMIIAKQFYEEDGEGAREERKQEGGQKREKTKISCVMLGRCKNRACAKIKKEKESHPIDVMSRQ
jgi:hypothetical protein